MAMQLGSAGNMFQSSDPINQFAMLQENDRQNQELAMRQQALQAQLRSQALQDQGQSTMNEANQAKLDEFYQTADLRLKSMQAALTGQDVDNSLKIQETMFRPDLWRSEIKHTQASTDAIKANVDLAKQSFSLEKNKFEIAKRAADQQFDANEIDNAFRKLQMPGLMQEQTQRIAMQAQALKTGAIQQHLMERQAAGFDMNQTLDRFRAYQQMAPELRKSAKKYMPEVYGDMPDYFEEDDIKSMQNAIGVLHYLKDDPTMALLGKANPAVDQVKAAAMQLLQRNMDKASTRGKTDTSITIDDAVTKMGKSAKNAAKKQEEASSIATKASSYNISDDLNVLDRIAYHNSQQGTAPRRPYADVKDSNYVKNFPMPFNSGKDASYSTIPKEIGLSETDESNFYDAIPTGAYNDGTASQNRTFRAVTRMLANQVAKGVDDNATELLMSLKGKLGANALTVSQWAGIGKLEKKYGWGEVSNLATVNK